MAAMHQMQTICWASVQNRVLSQLAETNLATPCHNAFFSLNKAIRSTILPDRADHPIRLSVDSIPAWKQQNHITKAGTKIA